MIKEISSKIRTIRHQQNLTLKDLSEKTGLSVSFLSQVERGTSMLAITSLKKIADALNVPITSFFDSHVNQNFIVKAEEHKPFRIEGYNAQYTRLSGEFSGRLMEPMLVILEPGKTHHSTLSHPGEEFYYVLEGAVVFNVDGQESLVNKGDSIHFPSELPHYWRNPTDEEAVVLCVVTPVIF
ncbi:helix-turn-helix domain-containing protein [Desulfofalx alkaliphila]|uniref:helix-turn-helix domain-containing protein n=1 Tax=Desulfofalx alkaliphila TaxID=105483 RepID=UPI00054D7B31|nr:XRE family transcriptional regulator [Desulfofalx alkaliphila]